MKVFFKTAKLAKEKGFDLPCYGSYTEYNKTQTHSNPSFKFTKGQIETDDSYFRNNADGDFSCEHYTQYAAPQKNDLRKWIRERFDFNFIIIPIINLVEIEYWVYIQKGVFQLDKLNDSDFFSSRGNFTDGKTFEKAYENALWSCLLKIKNNKKASLND